VLKKAINIVLGNKSPYWRTWRWIKRPYYFRLFRIGKWILST
jgi:hypothetical protein